MAAAIGESEDRSVLIPSGLTFSSLPIHVANVTNIEVVINGTLLVSKDHKSYQPKEEKPKVIEDFFTFYDTENLTISGDGLVDGQGFMWWMREYKNLNPLHSRPY